MTRKSSISSVLFGNFHTKFGKPLKIFRRTITLARGSIRTDKYLLIHDNGAETSKYNFEPFWRNDKLTFDLQFPVIRN